MTKQDFLEGFNLLVKACQAAVDAETTKIYWLALQKMPAEAFKRAVAKIIATRVYPTLPMPGEINLAAFGSPEERAELAIRKIERARRQFSSYTTIQFDDPLLNLVVSEYDCGWICVAEMQHEKWVFEVKALRTRYLALLNAGHPGVRQPLLGRTDDNALGNHRIYGHKLTMNPVRMVDDSPLPAIEYEPERQAAAGEMMKIPKNPGELLKALREAQPGKGESDTRSSA